MELSRDLTQHIVHIDCDAFYASVELLDRPELATQPFAVGGGVLTTCNYVARRYGVRSGMAGFVAKKLCPSLVLLRLNFDKYNAKAREVREVLVDYDARFESASIDEAYVNVTAYCADHGLSPAEAVARLRAEVAARTGITVSAGIAPNARLAKICSNINKPDGQFELAADRVAITAFVQRLPVRKVNGVGRVFERELEAVGIRTLADVYPRRHLLSRLFGEKARDFLLACYLGLGRTRVQPAEEYERKSVGTESTFRDLQGSEALRRKLRATADELEKDMRRAQCKGRTLVLKVKLHSFEVYTRQVVTPRAVCDADDLYRYALPVLTKLEHDVPGLRLRLMGLRCTHLISTKKPDAMAFFGLKKRPASGEVEAEPGLVRRSQGQVGRGSGSGGDEEPESEWEQWPEEELDGYEVDISPVEDDKEPQYGDNHDSNNNIKDGIGAAGEVTPHRRHGKEIVPNPTPKQSAKPEEEWWDCPICNRPQAANERAFNEHIDLCLSRRTIRDAVQMEAQKESAIASPTTGGSRGATPDDSKKTRVAGEKRRGRPPAPGDPRQKKLRFG